jgi:hypothetical protein
VPNTWYVILRLGQGFAAGVVVGVLWALWIIRQRRTTSPPGHRPSGFRIPSPARLPDRRPSGDPDTAAGRLATG